MKENIIFFIFEKQIVKSCTEGDERSGGGGGAGGARGLVVGKQEHERERENNLKNGGGDQHRIYLRISGVLRDRDIVSSDPGVASLFRFPRCGNWT